MNEKNTNPKKNEALLFNLPQKEPAIKVPTTKDKNNEKKYA